MSCIGLLIPSVLLLLLLALVDIAASYSCLSVGVLCVGSGYHTTFSTAMAACTEVSKCIIMIEGGTYTEPFSIDRKGGPSLNETGEVIPYDGDTVILEADIGDAAFGIYADFWKIHNGDAGGSFQLGAASVATALVEIATGGSKGIVLSGLTLTVTHGKTVEAGIIVSGVGADLDGVLFENLHFTFEGTGRFTTGIRVAGTGPMPTIAPELRPYRVKVAHCTIAEADLEGVYFKNVNHVHVDANYIWFGARMTQKLLFFWNVAFTVVTNNVFVETDDAPSPSFRHITYLSDQTTTPMQDHLVRHNTFRCDSIPFDGLIVLESMASGGDPTDPQGFLIQNNLISGCGSDAGSEEIVRASPNCVGSTMTCLGANAGELRCNRHSGSVTWLQTPGWVDNTVSVLCEGGGTGTFSFHESGGAPYPYYWIGGLTAPLGEDVGDAVRTYDYNGICRNRENPTMGAFRGTAVTCNGIDESLASVCHDTGTCICDDDCVCDDIRFWNGQWCDHPICNDTDTDNDIRTGCGGHGDCIAPEQCSCDADAGEPLWNGMYCHHPICADGLDEEDVRSGCENRGTCIGPGTCDCDAEFDDLWNGPFCDHPICDGVLTLRDVSTGCNDHGECVAPDTCLCDPHYGGAFCDVPAVCGAYQFDDPQVCRARGDCRFALAVVASCICDQSYYAGDECDQAACFTIPSDSEKACNSLGECFGLNRCDCVDDVYGAECGEIVPSGAVIPAPSSTWGGERQFDLAYNVSWANLPPFERLAGFDCSERLVPTEEEPASPLGIGATCTWNVTADGLWTTFVRVRVFEEGAAAAGTEPFIIGLRLLTSTDFMEKAFVMVTPEIVDDGSTAGLAPAILVAIAVLVVAAVSIAVFVVAFIAIGCVIARRRTSGKRVSDRLKSIAGGSEDELDLIRNAGQEADLAKLKINRNLFEVRFADLRILQKIGAGGSDALVFKAKWHGKLVAFKCFRLQDFLEKEKFDAFEREVTILSSVSHANILRFYGACLKAPRVGIVMEYCPNGDIQSYMSPKDGSEIDFPLAERVRVMMEIASSMAFLHAKSIIHRDLKCLNVLLDGKLSAKLMDFGLSRLVEKMSQTKTAAIGTNRYMAPEVCTHGQYTEKVDVFSYAVMIFEILTANFSPYGDCSGFNVEVRVALSPAFRPAFASSEEEAQFPAALVVLMREAWSHEPSERPSFVEIIQRLKVVRESLSTLE